MKMFNNFWTGLGLGVVIGGTGMYLLKSYESKPVNKKEEPASAESTSDKKEEPASDKKAE